MSVLRPASLCDVPFMCGPQAHWNCEAYHTTDIEAKRYWLARLYQAEWRKRGFYQGEP